MRLLGDEKASHPKCGAIWGARREEPSPAVRNQLACTCKRLPGRGLAAGGRTARAPEDVKDPHIPLLLWWAIEDKATTDRALVLRC